MGLRDRFRDRAEAGRVLAGQVASLDLEDPIVLGLARGGVPVAAEVASALGAPLEVVVARKIGAPGHEEFGIGAIAEGGALVCDRAVLGRLGVTDEEFARLAAAEAARVQELVHRYRSGRPLPGLRGRDVVLVDDGLATGGTAEAALTALRALAPATLVLGAPVCAAGSAERLAQVADRVECACVPARFHAVGAWYDDFRATSDAEVLRHLQAGIQR